MSENNNEEKILNSDKDVFDFMRSDPETALILDLLTFAAYSEKKYRWMEKYKDLNGRYPDHSEITRWISELPHEDLYEMRGTAIDFFDDAARKYLADEIEEKIENEKKSTLNNEILRSVGEIYKKSIESSSFSRQLLFSFITAILVPIILGVMVVAINKFDFLSVDKVTSYINGTMQK
jgi:hypothetical protein